MSTADRRFFLRLSPHQFPYVPNEDWVVGAHTYRGQFVDEAGAAGARRRVQLFHPGDPSRSVVLYADQLEPESHPW